MPRQNTPATIFNLNSTLPKVVFRPEVVDEVEAVGGTAPTESHHNAETRGQPICFSSVLEACKGIRLITPVLEGSNLVKDEASDFRVVGLVRYSTLLGEVGLAASNWFAGLDVSAHAENVLEHKLAASLGRLLIWL